MHLHEVAGSACDFHAPIDNFSRNRPKGGLLDAAFDVGEFRRCAELVVDKLEAHLSDDAIKGLSLTEPAVLLREVREILEVDGVGLPDREKLSAIIDLYLKSGIQVQSPGYMGRQFSSTIPLAGIFDFINSTVNQPSSFYEAGPLPNIAEHLMAEELNRFIGWPEGQFAMITTSGGSLANLTAILAARNDRFPRFWSEGGGGVEGGRPAIAVGADAHYSITRAAGILGIGEQQIVRLPLNQKKQICAKRAASALDAAQRRGLKVFCMVVSAGTTSTGAFDPLDELADLAHDRDMWLHVDGAHGASLLVSEPLREKLRGIDKADSFAWDAHKMMFVPAMCTLLFYRNKEKSYGAFHQDASYVFEKTPDIYSEFESAEQNFECTKRPLIMNLWVVWSLYGRELFAEKIEYLCHLTLQAFHIISHQPDFHPLHLPESNIFCFRYTPTNWYRGTYPDFQVAIRNRLRESGKFFISKVDVDGEPALRVVFMNHEITPDHFLMLLEEIRREGRLLLNEANGAMDDRSIA